MKLVLRGILSVFLGLISGMIVITLCEVVGHLIFPPPPGLDLSKPEALKELMAQMPVGAFGLLIMGWFLGTFTAAGVAALVAGRAPLVYGLAIGAVFLLLGISNLIMIPHPLWFAIISTLFYLPAGYLGGKLVSKKRSAHTSAPVAV